MTTTGRVIISGEISSEATVDYEAVARQVMREVVQQQYGCFRCMLIYAFGMSLSSGAASLNSMSFPGGVPESWA